MNIDLTETDASKINAALLESRRRYGSATYSAVLTLVIVTDEREQYDAVRSAVGAAREHPARILTVIPRPGRGEPRLDAEVRTSGENGPGEVVILRLYGELASHAESVVLPLLLPDAPVVTWWPNDPPEEPARNALGALGGRRVTDTATADAPLRELEQRARHYVPGDTDLSWTRLTPWRALLASALDVAPPAILGGQVVAEPDNASAELLARWLGCRLGVPVERRDEGGPGISDVVLRTEEGDIRLRRTDQRVALLSRPGWPERPVALARRSITELLTEELRRLDPDDVYGDTLHCMASGGDPGHGGHDGHRHGGHGGHGGDGQGASQPIEATLTAEEEQAEADSEVASGIGATAEEEVAR